MYPSHHVSWRRPQRPAVSAADFVLIRGQRPPQSPRHMSEVLGHLASPAEAQATLAPGRITAVSEGTGRRPAPLLEGMQRPRARTQPLVCTGNTPGRQGRPWGPARSHRAGLRAFPPVSCHNRCTEELLWGPLLGGRWPFIFNPSRKSEEVPGGLAENLDM